MVILNNRATVERAIQSVIDLDYPNIEFIVIDGMSTDGTVDVFDKYLRFIDRLIVEKDCGIYDAMNKGTSIARGAYFYFIGADDIIINSWRNLGGRLNYSDTVYYGNVYFPLTNQIYDGRFSTLKLLTKNICHQAIFYPRTVFEKYQYSDKYPLLADFYLNLLLKKDPDYKFKYINILVAVFSEKGISTTKKDQRFLNDRLEIVKQNYSVISYLFFFISIRLRKWLKKIT